MKGWICDTCGERIEKVEDGWVEWMKYPKDGADRGEVKKYEGKGLRLVHHRSVNPGCAYDQKVEYATRKGLLSDLPLSEFLGPDGLMQLLGFIATNIVPTEECLEMIKRLHIPEYEDARRFFDEAIRGEVFEPNTPEGYYRQSDIQAVLRWLGKRRM